MRAWSRYPSSPTRARTRQGGLFRHRRKRAGLGGSRRRARHADLHARWPKNRRGQRRRAERRLYDRPRRLGVDHRCFRRRGGRDRDDGQLRSVQRPVAARTFAVYGPKVVAVEGTDPETGEPTTTLEIVGKATVAQDLEPEFITVSPDSRRAWVTLQENNAIAEVDLRTGRVTAINGLGYKVHALPGNGMDASDRDDGINIKKWPVLGMYQPDAIASYQVGGQLYLLTANEGDARDWDGYSEVARIADLNLGFPMNVLDRVGPFRDFTAPENMGRLRTTTAAPFGMRTNRDGEDEYQPSFSYGARSFSVWSTSGHLVFDSGDDIGADYRRPAAR